MKGRIKASLLSVTSSTTQTANCIRVKQKQGFQSLPMIGILLYVPLFVGLLGVVSVAAPLKIAQTTSGTPRSSFNRPTLKVGSQGESVSELQAALKLLGFYTGKVDGVYNPTTATAVSRFKQAAGLKPDGIVDASTWQKLFPAETVASSPTPSPNANPSSFPSPTSNPEPTPATSPTSNPEPKPITSKTPNNTQVVNSKPEPKPPTRTTNSTSQRTVQQSSSSHTQQTSRSQSTVRQQAANPQTPSLQYTSEGLPILRKGMHGPEVVKLQQRLQKLGFFDANIDGDFGLQTEAAVQSVQKRYGLEPDGIAGGATWNQILRRR